MSSERPPQTSWWSKIKETMGPLFSWWPEFSKSKIGIAGLVIMIVMVGLILLAPVLATHGPKERDIDTGWDGGRYWSTGWTQRGNASITNLNGPYGDKTDDEIVEYHAKLQSDGYIKRTVDLSLPSEVSPHLQFAAKASSFEAGDTVTCLISPDGAEGNWIPVQTWGNGDDDNVYQLYDIDLTAYQKTRTFSIAFDADMTSPNASFYLDAVVVARSAPGYAVLSPNDHFEPYPQMYQAPSWEHLMGTNSQSEDVWSRLLYSGQNSLMIGFVAAFLITSIGASLGLTAGYFGGVIEELVMRLADILLIMPRLPLLIVLSAYLTPGPWTVIMLLTVTGWAGIARSTRAQTLSVKQHSYVEASRSVGASNIRIILQHILPNVAGIVIAAFVMEVVVAILVESGLSFLGLGSLSHPTWGVMLHFAQSDAAFTWNAWWWIVPPGLSIALVGLAFAFIGNTLNDRFVLRLGSRRKG